MRRPRGSWEEQETSETQRQHRPPGFVDTSMLSKTESRGFRGQGVDHHQATPPVRRVGRHEDIAAARACLVHDEADCITGQTIGVNGGRTT
ncbi:SDR family oxidoreductase [Yinghuangia sp. YIM S10712]|uniref:SDR family oxidoreductase n=1 Tax=Yinghuangia sp. YIM S10712 TaxID=3436930 RepID=UPI003F52B9E7